MKKQIKRPTAILLGGPRKEGVLMSDEHWYSNGHWLLHRDVFSTEPRAPKGIMVDSLAQTIHVTRTQCEEKNKDELVITDDTERFELPRYNSASKKVDVFIHRKLRSKHGKKDAVWINDAYVQWILGLEEESGDLTWLAGRTPLDPVIIWRGIECIGLVMPVRR